MNKFRLKIASVCSLCIIVILISSMMFQTTAESGYIDNSDVMPKYVSDEYMVMEDSNEDGTLQTPAWFKTAVIVEVRLDKASKDGTLEGCIPMLEHYQETGVNCLIVTPVSEMGTYLGKYTNGYTNNGLQTIEPSLTGTSDYTEGWERFAWFVREAHKRNIRLLLDFTIWGVDMYSDLVSKRPELFMHDTNGNLVISKWGGPQYDYEGEVFKKWYSDTMMNIIDVTSIDGIRMDLEPTVTGYDFWTQFRKEAYAAGHKIVIMSEHSNERNGAYDVEQYSIQNIDDNWNYTKQMQIEFYPPQDYYLDYFNPVESVKSGQGIGSQLSQLTGDGGQYRFYVYNLSSHDNQFTYINGNLLKVGYQGIFMPFITHWMMGEETNLQLSNTTLYYSANIDSSRLNNPKNRQFYETLKKYIRIRRSYPDIFYYSPINHRDSNICKVEVAGLEKYQAYARYDSKGNAILIVPNGNVSNTKGKMKVSVPFSDAGIDRYKSYEIIDLMNNNIILRGDKKSTGIFDVTVKSGEIGVYLVSSKEKESVKVNSVYKTETEDNNDNTGNGEIKESITENPITEHKTITKTVFVNKAGQLTAVFWITLAGCTVVVAGAVATLVIYLVRRKRRL